MCLDPATLTALQVATSVVGGVAQYGAERQAAQAQEDAQRQASLNEIKRYQMQVSGERLAERQENEARAMESVRADNEAEAAMSTLVTSSEERGTTGVSPSLAVDDYLAATARFQSSLEQQAKFDRVSRNQRLGAADFGFAQNWTRINKPIAKPNLLGTLVNTANQSFSAYRAGRGFEMQEDLYGQRADARASGLSLQGRTTAASRTQTGVTGRQRDVYGAGRALRITR